MSANAKANSDQATLGAQSAVSTSGGQGAGRVLSVLPALFLLRDAGMKLFKLTALTNSPSILLGVFCPFAESDRKNERLRPLVNSI